MEKLTNMTEENVSCKSQNDGDLFKELKIKRKLTDTSRNSDRQAGKKVMKIT